MTPSQTATSTSDHEWNSRVGIESSSPTQAENRLSILAVTSELPWPLNTGGHLRTFHLLRNLAKRATVRLVTQVFEDSEHSIKALGEHGIEVLPVRIVPTGPIANLSRVLDAALRSEPYVLYRRHNHHPFHKQLSSVRPRPDVLYLDHLDSLVYRNTWPAIPAVLDLHNAYSYIARRAALERPIGIVKIYLHYQSRLLRRIERQAGILSQVLLTVSSAEQAYFQGLGAKDVRLVPNGVDAAAYASLPIGRESNKQPLIVYVGAMSWEPNVRAATFLATEVLSVLQRRYPAARLRIIGRDPASAVLALRAQHGVEVTGAVPDVLPHLAQASILAVPLEAGGGTRLKILEAFAAGLPVVSTPVGCEGLDVNHNEHLVIADREHFAVALADLLDNPAHGSRLATAARSLAHQNYDWSAIGDRAWQAVRDAAHPGVGQIGGDRPS